MALLTENGPCTVHPDWSTTPNPHSWNANANVIWLDQPSNVGFSYTRDQEDVDKDEEDVGDNFFWFMNGFLDKHPELEGRDFYITGESYAGHYVPAAAHRIWQANKLIRQQPNASVRINLKGIAMGNALVNPLIQLQHQLDMVNNTYNITLLSDADLKKYQVRQPECAKMFEELFASGDFSNLPEQMEECAISPFKNAHRNPYDIRLPCGNVTATNECYNYSYISDYLNSDAMRAYLNISTEPQHEHQKKWLECDPNVGMEFAMNGDVIVGYESYVADLLNDGSVRVLLYAGDADTVCNWYGNKAWATALEWRYTGEFNAAADHAFYTGNGSVHAGTAKAYSTQLTFVKIFNAGHMAPRDQPAVAQEMIEKFFRAESF